METGAVTCGGLVVSSGDAGPGFQLDPRPTGSRTRIFFSTGMNCGLSAACPAVNTIASGRH